MDFVDQLNRTIHLEKTPDRIISLVPSQTELLYDLGLDSSVVGITKFCIHPDEWFRNKARVGGTKQVDIQKVRSLKPDLIIANKEENTKEDIAQLELICPVWISDVNTIEDAYRMILSIGQMTNKEDKTEKLVSQLRVAFSSSGELFQQKRFLYLIWKEPYYLAGKNTFIDAMLNSFGFVNAECRERYPEFEGPNPYADVILLSTEPYPFKAEHLEQVARDFNCKKVYLIDGEMCSWYGSRMLKSVDYFKELSRSIL